MLAPNIRNYASGIRGKYKDSKMTKRSVTSGLLATIIIAFGALPQQILAANDDGVVLINQSNVPYKIKSSGSYKLSSNLFPASKATAITVTTSNVTIDLNGFSIIGGVEGIDAHNQPLITRARASTALTDA
jgi:hypothetical protein